MAFQFLPFLKAAGPLFTAGAGLLAANISGNRAANMGRSSMLYGQQALHDKTRLAQDQTAWGVGQFLQSEKLGRANKKFDYKKMASAMSNIQVSTNVKHDSFGASSSTGKDGDYQKTARYSTKFV